MDLILAYWPLLIFGVVIIAIIALMQMYAPPQRLPYEARGKLVTKSELRFYKSLDKAVQDDFEIFAMVRIADLLKVEQGAANYRKWLNKILAKHIDFVLCEPGSLQPRVCIELDDASHQRPDRIERDEFVDHAFESAGLPLVRIEVQKSYSPREVRALIDEAI